MLPIKAVFCIVDTRKHFEKSRGHLYLYIRGYYSYSTPLDRNGPRFVKSGSLRVWSSSSGILPFLLLFTYLFIFYNVKSEIRSKVVMLFSTEPF